MPKISQTTKVVRATSVIAGLTKHFPPREDFHLQGKHYSLATLRALFQSHLDALEKIRRAHVALAVAVREERAVAKRVRSFESLLKFAVTSRFGPTSPAFADFGWSLPKKPGPKTAAAKRAGAEKVRATRAARGTMGKQQRKRSERGGSRV